MKRLFLYRLLKYNKIAATFLVGFIVLYGIFFYKKMDVLLFPYNNMFTQQLNKNYIATTYVMKVNNTTVRICDNWYTKKDFSEASLTSFSKWLLSNKQGYMNQFVQQKTNDSNVTNQYKNKFFVDENAAETWPQWFAHFNNIDVQKNDTISIWQYRLQTNVTPVVIIDAVIIYKKSLQ